MSNDHKIKLFLVDDDALYLKLLEIEFLESADFSIETYATGELCLEKLSNAPDIIILDYLLDGVNKNAINGIKTLDKIKEFDAAIPVIMLSCQDKIEVAIDCMHHDAFDYVVKSETSFLRLKQVIKTILRLKKISRKLA